MREIETVIYWQTWGTLQEEQRNTKPPSSGSTARWVWSYCYHGDYIRVLRQFDDNVLDVALSLISSLSADECRSPVGVSRGVVSRIVTRDNTGVLLKGSGATGAVHPCRWNGSTLILQKYHRTGTPAR